MCQPPRFLAASLGANNGIHLNKQGLNPFAPTDGDGGRGASQGNQDGGVLNFLSNLGGGRPFYLGENIVGGEEGNSNKLVTEFRSIIGEFNYTTGEFSPGPGRGFGGLKSSNSNERERFDTGSKFNLNTYPNNSHPSAFQIYGNSEIAQRNGAVDSYNAIADEPGFFIRKANVGFTGRELVSESKARNQQFSRFYVGGGVSEIADERYNTGIVSELEETNLTSSAVNHLDPNSTDRQNLNTLSAVPQPSDFFVDFRRINNENHIGPDYNEKNIERRVMTGNPGAGSLEDRNNYQEGKTNNPVADKINFSPIYRSGLGPDPERVRDQVNDLVKFRIAAIDSNNPSNSFYMHFRSYIDSFQDNYNASWDPQKFLGRGESFYKYQGFDRDIALSFTVAAQSKPELMRMYHKLNYLASNLMPDFTSAGYMSGPLLRLTVGGYLYEQYGFLQSLNYQIPNESPWEIAIPSRGRDENNSVVPFSDPTVKEMPHIIQVTGFQFKPIHNFVPRKQRLGVSGNDRNGVDRFGRERFIALSNGFDHASGYNADNYNG